MLLQAIASGCDPERIAGLPSLLPLQEAAHSQSREHTCM